MRKYLVPLLFLFVLSACDYKAKNVCEQGQRLMKKSLAESIVGYLKDRYIVPPVTDKDVDVASTLIQSRLVSAKAEKTPDQYYCVSEVKFKKEEIFFKIPTVAKDFGKLTEKDKQHLAEIKPTTLLVEYKAKVIGDFIKVNIVGVTEVK